MKKGRGLTINISARAVYGIIGIFVLLIASGVAFAFGGTSPTIMGHSAAELEGVCLSDGTNCPVFSAPTIIPEIVLERIETWGNIVTVENHCVTLSNSFRECHVGAGMDSGGSENIYCYCWSK